MTEKARTLVERYARAHHNCLNTTGEIEMSEMKESYEALERYIHELEMKASALPLNMALAAGTHPSQKLQ